MAARLLIGASLLIIPVCENAGEGFVVGGAGSGREVPLMTILLPQLSSLGPSMQASRRFFLSNLLSTFECEDDVKDGPPQEV